MVGSVVGYHGSLEILFQAAHAVHRALGARDGPCAGEVLADALVWLPFRGKLLVGDERHFDFGILAFLRHTPCRRAVGYERVGEEDYGSHVFDCDACGLESHMEAVGR